MRFGYADPPYPGMARKYYGCDEVDHQELVEGLTRQFPHGWALSSAASTLQEVLAMCPAGVRVASWVKGPRQSISWRPRSAWEPLIIYRGRPRRIDVDEYSCDVLTWGGRQQSHPGALVGMKPAAFAEWMFIQLGALAGDILVDLFPGSGAIMRAWEIYFDPSPRGGRDVSQPGKRDTPPPGGDDGSDTRAEHDTSRRDRYRRDSCYAGAVRHLEQAIKTTEGNQP